ncbi:GLUTAMATE DECARBOXYLASE [Salix koriyanagi]|uniref:Glutamate decarboxylase n=1 Tax=Salix koriyanagi TaxID=2511006 RepID=A0A9Q0WRK9_9ROSI|nr:GLUTAMATE DECARBOXYLASE [Salix koriyanagi]
MVLSKIASQSDVSVHSTFASRYVRESFPRYKMPENSIPKEAAFQIINDELMLDGKPRLNLASFVTTWMEPECDKLIMDSINKNYVDMDEYPVTTELQILLLALDAFSKNLKVHAYDALLFFSSSLTIEVRKLKFDFSAKGPPSPMNRCVNIIAHLFNAPLGESEAAVGVGTVGSSEAIMLAGLAFKRKWQNKRKAEGKPHDKPNIVTGANVQVCWEKFARYFEVELKEVKLSEDYYVMDPVKAVEMVDENTICVAAILGSTLNGEFEDVKLLNDLLVEKNKITGWDTPIHVDAASGGFIAPFLWPELEWDFRLPLVKSINVSGHKYGLVYAGVGWVIWRSKEDLPEELIFHINYLGTDQPTFTLNFSKGSSQIIAQYYQLIRLGYEGYRNVMENCHENAMMLKEGLEKTGRFKIVSKDIGVPVVAFSLKNKSWGHDEFEIAETLRRFGWIVPAYTMPADAKHITVLRVVIREDFSRTLAERLVHDITRVLHELDSLPAKLSSAKISVKQEENGKINGTVEGKNGTTVVIKKTATETQREITIYWKNFVTAKKSSRNKIC